MVIRRQEPRALVDKDRAYEHALMTVRRSWAGETEGLEEIVGASLSPDPLVIHDLNGEPLFYEFQAGGRGGEVGRIKTAASELVGTAVVTVEQGRRGWSPDEAKKMAVERANKLYPRSRAEAQEFVCYCYPKIGVRVELSGESEGESGSVIFDVSDGSQITSFGDADMEGQTAYSFLDSIDAHSAEERQSRFRVEDQELNAAREKTPRLFERELSSDVLLKAKSEFLLKSSYTLIPFYSSRVLKYALRCNPHDCFELYAQQTNVYCAVATGQMILDFYRRYFDQTDIAAAMGTGGSGTSNAGQVAGYESLSNGCLVATYDTSANWSEAKAEIDANRPVKSGIPGHARVCTGWKRQNFWLFGTQPKRWLRIHDPWPWNSNICSGGAVYWEDWDAVYHTNFIYVRHNTTSHS